MVRCLEALRVQRDAPEFDILVVYDPNIKGVAELGARYGAVRFVRNENQRTPLEIGATAMALATGDFILLTEDHCVPRPNWVRVMVEARRPDRAVVGGRVEIACDASATDWAFYFVDFFRYAAPVPDGPSPSLTVCNAGYERVRVDEIRDLWKTFFLETAVNDALSERFGDLWLEPRSEVTMGRHVSLGDALYERYAFGRLFGYTRNGFVSGGERLYYLVFSPVLPILIGSRILRKALRDRRLLRAYCRAVVPLTLMVLWWSWGEFLGYLTGGLPPTLIVAPEIRSARRNTSAS